MQRVIMRDHFVDEVRKALLAHRLQGDVCLCGVPFTTDEDHLAHAADNVVTAISHGLHQEMKMMGPEGGIACLALCPVDGDTLADGHRITMGQPLCSRNRNHDGPHSWEQAGQ